jgi:hypothetical protein
MGEVSRYKGEVPKKNIAEIAKFHNNNPVKEQDNRYVAHNMRSWDGKEATYSEYKAHYDRLHNSSTYQRMAYSTNYSKDTGYKICASLKDMNMDRAELKGNRIVNIPDPVVLYPVTNGYLIISAWGIEANDEYVVNQKMN